MYIFLDLVNIYNNWPIRSLRHKSSNSITKNNEIKDIKKISGIITYHFQEGESVKVILDKASFSKRSTNVST